MTEQLPCPQCTTLNRPLARFCTNCGTTLSGGESGGFVQLSSGRVMHNRYTILHPLGKGGMGAVYLASETIARRQRQVVVKEMLEYYDPDDPQGAVKARQRFEAEAATLVSLNFAGIPQIFDFFSDGGRNYIVMQFIEGQNLEMGLTRPDEQGNVMPGGPYPVEQVRAWGVQICKVLENLASQNVVHMDIKPANLIRDRSGDVWLVDFGTAKAQWVIQPGGRVGMQKSSVYGTAGYAPPEQYAGKAEPRSDVYGLAATLYHLLTDDDPRIHPFNFPRLGGLPPDLATALERTLVQNVSQRITAAEFRQLLDVRPVVGGPAFRWKDGTVSQKPEELTDASNHHWDEARGYFLSGAWESWFETLHRNDLLSTMAQVKSKYQGQNLALDAFLRTLDPSFPAPSLHLSHTRLDTGPMQWGQRRTFSLEVQNRGGGWLQGRFEDLPDWIQITPERFALHDRQKVKVMVNTRKLAPHEKPHKAQWLVNAGLAGREQISAQVAVHKPRWLPAVRNKSLFIGILSVGILLALVSILFAAFILLGGSQTSSLSPASVPLIGTSFQQGVLFTSTRDGKMEIYRLVSDTGVERVTRSPGNSESWSAIPEPGGGLLFTSDRDGKREIYRLYSEGVERVTRTNGGAESWSPIPVLGGEFLFTSDRDGKREVYRLTSEGVERVTHSPGTSESWSPVPEPGGGILFTSNRDGRREIYRLYSEGVERVTRTPGSAESWSPVPESGGGILFTSDRDGKREIYRLISQGVERVTHTPGDVESWSPLPELGEGILFVSNRDGKDEVYRLTSTGVERVTNTSGSGESWLLSDW